MYRWKYWRESRITFGVGMVFVVLLLWSLLHLQVEYPGRGVVAYSQNGVALNPAHSLPPQIYLVVISILTFPLGLLGLCFGSFGVGRDLGNKCGTYLFTRPRSRAFFVWSDWGYGIGQLLLLVLAANAVLAFGYYRIAPGSGPILVGGAPVSMLRIFCLHCVAGLLLAGLVFGLTYFCSVLARGRGVLLAVGVLLAYLIAKSVVHHYWLGVTLPDISLTEFAQSPHGNIGFADHLGLSIALRSALVVAFPVAAQWLLQSSDID